MRTFLALAIAGCAAAFVACSGTDATVTDGDGGGSDATSSDGATGDASGGDSGGTTDGGASDGADASATDAKPDARDGGGGNDSGITPDPNNVACGMTSCPTPAQFCCVDYSDGGSHTCAQTANLSACFRGTRQACDEAADCAGQVCCVEVGSGFGETTRCMPTCITGAIRYQACRTNAECENHQPCRLVTCPNNLPMGMCEVPPGCQ